MPFYIDNNIYESDLLNAYINIFKPKSIKINMDSDAISKNLNKKEWCNNKGKECLSIIDVILNKKKHNKHYSRMLSADMKYPIIMWKNIIIDGNHRLGNAYINNNKYIKVYKINNKIMNKIKIGTFKNMKEYNEVVNNYTQLDYIMHFYKNFLKVN